MTDELTQLDPEEARLEAQTNEGAQELRPLDGEGARPASSC